MTELFSPHLDQSIFRSRPDMYELLRGLAGHFQISWANERLSHRTKLFVLILRPSNSIKEIFGFEKEIALFLSRFPTVEPRTFQAIDQFCHESPLNERIDPSLVLFNSPDPNLLDVIATQHSQYPQSRVIVGLTDKQLDAAKDDPWKIRNSISETLFIRDLFNYKLPLQPNQYFYGRDALVGALIDSAKKGQNSGLFGLRKVGKTSVLLRVAKILSNSTPVDTIYFDCKKRYIRNLDCDGLIARIVKSIDDIYGSNSKKELNTGMDATEVLERAVKGIKRSRRICLIFDEIEYISPTSPSNTNWTQDFVDLWQVIWSIQSETQKICFIVCGVNPTVCEESRLYPIEYSGRSVQNPMFGIVNIQYLKGFERDALGRMVTFFGRRMGLIFTEDAIDYIFERFGGHPLLSRLACSFYHETFIAASVERPININASTGLGMEHACEAEISAYCEHIISEIREFYPNEFDLLMLASRDESEKFYDMATVIELAHIRNYGLLEYDGSGPPVYTIPVLKHYLQERFRKENNVNFYRSIISRSKRSDWFDRKKRSIEDDIYLLNEELRDTEGYELFPGEALKKIGDFLRLGVVDSADALTAFLVTTNRVFTEKIEESLKKQGISFSQGFQERLPHLQDALLRLKVYRHSFGHNGLTGRWISVYEEFIKRDFGSDNRKIFREEPFWMQQVVVEEMHIALQYEMARY
ncbi:MAG: ATP-binding protein [Pseudomonadota bacterium]